MGVSRSHRVWGGLFLVATCAVLAGTDLCCRHSPTSNATPSAASAPVSSAVVAPAEPHDEDKVDTPKRGGVATDEVIARLWIGMRVSEALQILGPSLPTKMPIYSYTAPDGSQYHLFFIDTKEAKGPVQSARDEPTLRAISKSKPDSGATDLGDYILPAMLRGQRVNFQK